MSGAVELPDTAALVVAATATLTAAEVPSPRRDAELLAAHALDCTPSELARRLVVRAPVPPGAAEVFAGLVRRRAAREPLQHLTGRAPFRGLEVEVGRGVFVPRPETEVVAGFAIEEARRLAADGTEPLVVDLCTGSGAIALAVAHEVPAARVVAVELDPAALAWARRNLASLAPRAQLRAGDVRGADAGVLSDLAGEVDVVVSNPPYIPPDAQPLEPEVRDHDPVLALYGGGDDGLEVPRAVVAAARGLLRPGGLLVMEHAEVQAGAVRRLAPRPVWDGARTAADLTGRPRALLARRAGPPPTAAGAAPERLRA